MKTKGEIEAEISEAMVKFELEYMGRGPKEVRSFIVEDMVLVRLKGVLTQAEQQLAKSSEGVDLIKMLRTTLIKKCPACSLPGYWRYLRDPAAQSLYRHKRRSQ